MIPRNHPQYVDIENFEDHELTICIAYEMAIRSPDVIRIINRNLCYNSYWYAIDVLCRTNLILSKYGIKPIDSLSAINTIVGDRSTNPDLKKALKSFSPSMDSEIYVAVIPRGLNYRYTAKLDISYQFYTLVEKLQSEMDGICFEDVFIELENIGTEENLDNLIESAQAIESFYKSLTPNEQNFIKKLIVLNIYKNDREMHYNFLYTIPKSNANTLQYKYYLDTFDKDDICTMQKLHLSYTFINIYDNRVSMKMDKDEPVYNFTITPYMTSLTVLTDEPLVILRQRPLLKMAKTVEDFVMNLPKTDFIAQIDWVKKRYEDLEKAAKSIGMPSIFFPDNTKDDKKPYKNKNVLADIFFLYDNTKIIRKKYDKQKEKIEAEHSDIKTMLETHKTNDQMSYNGCTFGEKLEELENDIQENEDEYYKELDEYILHQLAKYHNKITVDMFEDSDDGRKFISSEEMSLDEYTKRMDSNHPNTLLSDYDVETSYPGMKTSSRSEKYKILKEFIEEGKYKNLL